LNQYIPLDKLSIYKKHRRWIVLPLVGALAIMVVAITLLASVPPVSRDALTHHLYIPKLYIQAGGIYEIPSLPYSYYPMNLDLLYLIPLSLGNDIAPKFIHFMFALATAWLIWWHLKKRLNQIYALLGVLLFLSIPIVVKLSIIVYVDLGLVFFSTASLLYIVKWAECRFHMRYLAVSAGCCGLALGTKYNGLIVLLLITLFVPLLYSKCSENRSGMRSIAFGVFFCVVALLFFSPWMIRTFAWTGNPIYPLYDQIFNPGSETDSTTRLSHFVIRHFNYKESWWQMALIPFRIFFQGEDGNPKYFDGRLNPLLFFLPLMAFLKRRPGGILEKEKRLLAVFSVLFVLFVFFQRDMRIRYIAPVIPPLVILSVYGIHQIQMELGKMPNPSFRRLAATLLLLVGALLFSGNVLYIVEQFHYVKPITYLSGKLERDAYIEQYRQEYPAMQFANENLQKSSTVLGLFLGNRGYYSDRKMLFDEQILGKSLSKQDAPEGVLEDLYRNGVSHLLIRQDLFVRWINDNFEPKAIHNFNAFIKKCTQVMFSKNGYTLLSLSPIQS